MSHTNLDLSPLVSVEATGIYVPTENGEILLPSLYISLGCVCSGVEIIKPSNFRPKSLLTGDPNVKNYLE